MNVEMQKLGAEHSAIREIFEQANARALQIGRENVFDFSLGNPNVPAPDCVQEELKRLVSEMPRRRGCPRCANAWLITCGARSARTREQSLSI